MKQSLVCEFVIKMMSTGEESVSTFKSISKRELLQSLYERGSTPLKSANYTQDVQDFLLERFRISPDSEAADVVHAKGIVHHMFLRMLNLPI